MHASVNEPNILSLFDLRNRAVPVTGACGHLVSAMACVLAEAGAQVITTSRDIHRAQTAADSLPSHADSGHFGVAVDHADAESIVRCIRTATERTGRVDIRANNPHSRMALELS